MSTPPRYRPTAGSAAPTPQTGLLAALAIRARLGDLQDEESLQAVEEFIGQLEAKEKTRRGILRRGK